MHLDSKLKSLSQKGYESIVAKFQNEEKTNPSESEVRVLASEFVESQNILIPKGKYQQLLDSITYSVVGLGPLEFLLRDESVSEIMVNGADTIFVEKNGQLEKTELSFINDDQLIKIINRIVGKIGRRIDESNPLVDARLLDGSRVNAIISPLSLTGPTLTIRKFPTKSFSIQDMLSFGSINKQMALFLERVVSSQKNVVVSGGTGAGKTSTLNACATLIPSTERLITIEDAAEIRIDHPHLISLEARSANIEGKGAISIRTLLKNALRMRPDRIIVGEIRGGEAIDMLQAMNTGHKGSLTTVHANSPLESLYRIETMVLMGDVDLPLSAIRPQVISGVDVVVQQNRLNSGKRRVTDISIVDKDLDNTDYQVHQIFRYQEDQDLWEYTGYKPAFIDSEDPLLKQLKNE